MLKLPAPFALIGLSALALLTACSPQAANVSGEMSSDVAVEAAGSAPASEAVQSAIAPNFRALGTEPFWSAKVEGGTLIWSTPEQPEGAVIAVERNDRDGAAIIAGTVNDRPLKLEVHQEACSDGMSDTVYPLSVTLRLGGDVQRGCAR